MTPSSRSPRLRTLYGLELRRDPGRLRLRYSPWIAALIVAVVVLQFFFLWLVAQGPLEVVVPIGGFLGLVAGVNVLWILWWSVVVFDLVHDSVRRGPRDVGRVSDIRAVVHHGGLEAWLGLRPGLQLVFQPDGQPARRWTIPRVRGGQAGSLGAELAEALEVPFE